MSNQELIDKLFIHQVLLSTKDDMIPEERSVYTFYVTSASAGATISAESSRATITFAASDFPYGLIGFDSDDDIRVSEVNYFSLSAPPPPSHASPHPTIPPHISTYPAIPSHTSPHPAIPSYASPHPAIPCYPQPFLTHPPFLYI